MMAGHRENSLAAIRGLPMFTMMEMPVLENVA